MFWDKNEVHEILFHNVNSADFRLTYVGVYHFSGVIKAVLYDNRTAVVSRNLIITYNRTYASLIYHFRNLIVTLFH